MADNARPVPAQVRGDVDRCLSRLAELTPADDDWSWHVRRLAEAMYGLGYADGHTAGSNETWTDVRRKEKHEKRGDDEP